MRPEIPKNEKEFNKLMEEINDLLKNRNIPICNRSFHSSIEIAKKLKISIPLVPIKGESASGVYDSDSLSAHIHNWYQRMYGYRLNVQTRIGSGIILIRNDPWRVIYPMILGDVSFVCENDLEKYKNSPSFTTDGTPPVINILNLIEEMSNDYAQVLAVSELREIKQTFLSGLESLSCFDRIKAKPFIKEAKIDLENAVNDILSNPAHYGQSKGASLQFSEKLLKCFLKERTSLKIPKIHKLSDLYRLAVMHGGLSQFSKDLLAQVQCRAGVRYGEEIVDLDEAVRAHYSSLRICFFVAREIVL